MLVLELSSLALLHSSRGTANSARHRQGCTVPLEPTVFTSTVLHQAATWRPQTCSSLESSTKGRKDAETTATTRSATESARKFDTKRTKRPLWLQQWRPRSIFFALRRAFNALTYYAREHKSNALTSSSDLNDLNGSAFDSISSRNDRISSAGAHEDTSKTRVHKLQEGEAVHKNSAAAPSPLCPAGTHQIEPSWAAWVQGLNYHRHSSSSQEDGAIAFYACAPCPLNHVCPYNASDFGAPLKCPPDSHPSMLADQCDLNCREGYMWTGNSCTLDDDNAVYIILHSSLIRNRGQRRRKSLKWVKRVLDDVQRPWRILVPSSSSSFIAPHVRNMSPSLEVNNLSGDEDDNSFEAAELDAISTNESEGESLHCYLFGNTWESATHFLATVIQFGTRLRTLVIVLDIPATLL